MHIESDAHDLVRAAERATSEFIHLPGPNPILTPGASGSWDDGVIECCDVFKDHDTYYLYYHGTSSTTGYQLGVATASAPLGPWTKHAGNPVLRTGAPGSWDDWSVACAGILKEGVGSYTMLYSGRSGREGAKWHLGLATAPGPVGPWTKHEGNPILEDFGYVGGVIRAQGSYWLYTEHPIGSTGEDYGPMCLATAPSLEGPWTPHGGNPVLAQGEWGEWDDGGFSEAKVLYRDGLFHMFYGGAKLHPRRILSRESIGYAYSLDGVHFVKHAANPVAPREANPDAAAFAEVHAYFEPPFVYVFHTLRYNSRDGHEDLGVQVLATGKPFRLNMPVLRAETLAPGAVTDLADCPPISLARVSACAVTAECTYSPAARGGLRVHLRASGDGLRFDTEDLRTFDLPWQPGQTVRATFEFAAAVMFVKATAENLDSAHEARDVRLDVTLGSGPA